MIKELIAGLWGQPTFIMNATAQQVDELRLAKKKLLTEYEKFY
jgi:hypothetical protein